LHTEFEDGLVLMFDRLYKIFGKDTITEICYPHDTSQIRIVYDYQSDRINRDDSRAGGWSRYQKLMIEQSDSSKQSEFIVQSEILESTDPIHYLLGYYYNNPDYEWQFRNSDIKIKTLEFRRGGIFENLFSDNTQIKMDFIRTMFNVFKTLPQRIAEHDKQKLLELNSEKQDLEEKLKQIKEMK